MELFESFQMISSALEDVQRAIKIHAAIDCLENKVEKTVYRRLKQN